MNVAFLFPGQGQPIARDVLLWSRASSDVRRLVEGAVALAGVRIEDLEAAEGPHGLPAEVLNPVHTALCLGIHEELAGRGVRSDFVAGHSLGEVAACAAAGACSPAEAVELAGLRGRLMAREATAHPGGMFSIHAADADAAAEAVAFAREGGVAALAAHNAPDQWVISGEWPALRRLATRYPGSLLPMPGPWHCDALAGAVEEFRAAARAIFRAPSACGFVCNQSGSTVTRADALADLLAEQFTRPVQWVRCLNTMAAQGVGEWITVGPGRILRALCRRTPAVWGTLRAVDHPTELERPSVARV